MVALLFLFAPPSAHTNHKLAYQSAHQKSLSAVHKVLYLGSFPHRAISSCKLICDALL
jgi:hypothetical protein